MADEEKISNKIEETNESGPETEVVPPRAGYITRFARWVVLGGAALITFVICFVLFMVDEGRNYATDSADIVMMGDSIFAHTNDETSVAYILAGCMNTTVADMSFGGSCMSYIDRDGRMDYNADAFSMAALTQAIIAQDFRYQNNTYIRDNGTEYFKNRVSVLENIDFNRVDILIIDHLLNDYQDGVPIESGSDEYDEYTYAGALRSVLTQLKEKYPNLRIILIAPVKTWYGEECIPSDEKDNGSGTVDGYIDVQKALAEELGVEWLSLYDVYDEAVKADPKLLKGENGEDLMMWEAFTTDHIHPNETARRLIAEKISAYLSNGE